MMAAAESSHAGEAGEEAEAEAEAQFRRVAGTVLLGLAVLLAVGMLWERWTAPRKGKGAAASAAAAGTATVGGLDPPRDVYFYTHYEEKLTEVKRLLGVDDDVGRESDGGLRLRVCPFGDLVTWEDPPSLEWLAEKRVREMARRLETEEGMGGNAVGDGATPVCALIEEAALCLQDTAYPGHAFRDIVNTGEVHRWSERYAGSAARITLVAALYLHGKVHIFSESQQGTIVASQQRTGANRRSKFHMGHAIGWDHCFAPDGYDNRTIADMIDEKHVVDVRAQLYLQFRELLLPNMPGTVETHITLGFQPGVREDAAALREVVRAWPAVGAACAVKPLVLIEGLADDGHGTPPQLQLQTAKYASFKTMADAVASAQRLAQSLAQRMSDTVSSNGGDGRLAPVFVARVRVEAMAHSRHSPRTRAEAAPAGSTSYFEYHQRVCEPTAADEAMLHRMHDAHPGSHFHVSHGQVFNAETGTWRLKYFINARFFKMGKVDADAAWDAMHAQLETSFVEGKHTLKEYAVYDDAIKFDDDPDNPCHVEQAVLDDVFRGEH